MGYYGYYNSGPYPQNYGYVGYDYGYLGGLAKAL